MTIDDFRGSIKILMWSSDIEEVFERETAKMMDNLFLTIKRCIYRDPCQENDINTFPLSAGEDLEVSILISQNDSTKSISNSYELTFHRRFKDKYIGIDSYCKRYSFARSLFTVDTMSNENDGGNTYPSATKNSGFQLYQELWCMSYLPKFFEKHEIKSERTYIDGEGESAFLTFTLPADWFFLT